MPTFYNFTENNIVRSFDDVFVPADVFRDGNLWIWGSGGFGKIGNNTSNNQSTPVTLFSGGSNWKQVACGSRHTAAIKTDGTLWLWGDTTYGQLGNNTTTTSRLTPVTTFAGGNNWKQVSCSSGLFSGHTTAIKTDGTLWTWGKNNVGQLGTADLLTKSIPVTTFAGGTNWKQVSAGREHNAAIKTDGTLWTWGYGNSGRLGINSVLDKSTPVTTFAGGSNWKEVDCGYAHTAAIKTDGTLWTWGLNSSTQLGDNTITQRNTPVTTFSGGTNWKQLSCGGYYVAAVKTDGTLWVWGYNLFLQLGINNTTTQSTPVTTFAGGTNWKQVSCNGYHTAAIKTDGTLWVWGNNNTVQLGTNDTIRKSTPVTTFAGGTNWKQVSCGNDYTAAVTYIDSVI